MDAFKLNCPRWNDNIVTIMNFRRGMSRFNQLERTAGDLLAPRSKKLKVPAVNLVAFRWQISYANKRIRLVS